MLSSAIRRAGPGVGTLKQRYRPFHGTPSFRILVHGTEVFADHDEPDKLTPTTPRLKTYANLKRYLDEQLPK